MQTIEFFIPGEPVAKGRPRFARLGAIVKAFTPKKTVNAEANIRFFASKAMEENNLKPFDGPLFADITVYFHRPVSVNRIHHCTKPDADNMQKSIFDSLNGIIYIDDAQITNLVFRKKYTSDIQPREGIQVKILQYVPREENKIVKQKKGKCNANNSEA